MKLGKIKSDPIPTTFHFRGESLNLSVDADMLTPKFIEQMRVLAQGANAAAKPKKKTEEEDGLAMLALASQNNTFMIETLSRVIVTWDLEGDEGQILPVTASTFENLPQVFLSELFQFVNGVAAPKPQTAPTSGAS